jgi:hypothetical protein
VIKAVELKLKLTATSLRYFILALIRAKNKRNFTNANPLEVQSDG